MRATLAVLPVHCGSPATRCNPPASPARPTPPRQARVDGGAVFGEDVSLADGCAVFGAIVLPHKGLKENLLTPGMIVM